MSWTKRQIIESAFAEAGLAAFAFDLSANQLNLACRQLDSMMTAWDADGVKLGYAFSVNPDNSDPDTASNVPPYANLAVVQSLAVLIAPGYGKQISLETKSSASVALSNLKMRFAVPAPMKLPEGSYLGQGTRTTQNYPYFTPADDEIIGVSDNGQLEL